MRVRKNDTGHPPVEDVERPAPDYSRRSLRKHPDERKRPRGEGVAGRDEEGERQRHELGSVTHQRLGRLRLGAVDGAAGLLPVLARHGVLPERDPDAPRVLLARLLDRSYAG